jgi:anti-anti-sigma factor
VLSLKRAKFSASEGPAAEFAITVGFMTSTAVIGVRGAMDRLGARELGAILDAVIERYPSVVLELAELAFMNSYGLEVIATRASRLRDSQGTLTIRSPSALVVRMLHITGVAHLIRLEYPQPSRHRLGAEQSTETGDRLGTQPQGLSRNMRMIKAIPADVDVVDGVLRLVAALARATVGGADGVSVSLRRHGQLATVAASDQTISDMDANQYATGEGPCVDASLYGRWFHAEALVTETRWPAFTPRAQALGINAILSSPLLANDQPVGALNIYSRTAMAFKPKAQELASVFATETSLILANAGVGVSEERLSRRLGEALSIRRVIAQAEGVIMEREGIGADEAYGVLCDYSRQSNQPFRAGAAEVTASTQRLRPEPGETHRD